MKKVFIVLGIILVLLLAFKLGKGVIAFLFSALYTGFGLGLIVIIALIVGFMVYSKKKTTK